jgi:hypothetical protein
MFLFAFYSIIPFLFLLGLIFIGVSIGARKEPDPGGRRPYALYLLAVIFMSLLAVYVSVAGVGAKTVELIVTDYDAGGPGDIQLDDGFDNGGVTEFVNLYEETRSQDVSALLSFGLVLVVSGALLVWHWNRLEELKGESSFARSPAERTYTAYVYLTVFAALVVAATAVVFGVQALGDVITPSGLANGPSGAVRDAGYVEIVSALLAGLVAAKSFQFHWKEGVRLREASSEEPALT